MRKRYLLFWIFLLLGGDILRAYAEETEEPFAAEVSLFLGSDYMYRGANLYDGFSIQPALTLLYDSGVAGIFSLGTWMHISGQADRERDAFNEFDVLAAWSYSLEVLTVGTGHSWYTFDDPNEIPLVESGEFYFRAAVDIPLKPAITAFFDYRAYKTHYYEFTMEESIALGDSEIAIVPHTTVGFATDKGVLYADQGLLHITSGISLEIPNGNFVIVPTLEYTDAHDEATVNQLWFGTSLVYTY